MILAWIAEASVVPHQSFVMSNDDDAGALSTGFTFDCCFNTRSSNSPRWSSSQSR